MLKKILKSLYYTKFKKMDVCAQRMQHLRKIGMKIGTQSYIFSDQVETAEPYLFTIGKNVMIAPEVKFTTHDASAIYYLDNASDLFGRISIEDDCFIGMGAIILPGVCIAKGCIIGAGSVVTKSCSEPYSVYAGNPAKRICSVSDLKAKHSIHTLNTHGLSYEAKKAYLLSNEDRFIRK